MPLFGRDFDANSIALAMIIEEHVASVVQMVAPKQITSG